MVCSIVGLAGFGRVFARFRNSSGVARPGPVRFVLCSMSGCRPEWLGFFIDDPGPCKIGNMPVHLHQRPRRLSPMSFRPMKAGSVEFLPKNRPPSRLAWTRSSGPLNQPYSVAKERSSCWQNRAPEPSTHWTLRERS